jgi:hypothetical protein
MAELNADARRELVRAWLAEDKHVDVNSRPSSVSRLVAAGFAVSHGRPNDHTDCGCGFFILTKRGIEAAALVAAGQRVDA